MTPEQRFWSALRRQGAGSGSACAAVLERNRFPASAMMAISFSDRTVRPKDVEFSLLSNGRELWITLFFDGYRESERAIWGQIGYLLLDQALGEYDVETKVGPIQLMRRSQVPSMSFLAHCFHSAAK